MEWALVWLVAALTANGPVTTHIGENTRFSSLADCMVFGHVMSPRTADYARGMLRLDWDDGVKTTFDCYKVGDPT